MSARCRSGALRWSYAAAVGLLLTTVGLSGCGDSAQNTRTAAAELRIAPPLTRSALTSAFRAYFCAALEPRQHPCTQWLRADATAGEDTQIDRINADETASARRQLPPPSSDTVVLIASGLFSDCVSRWFKAFDRSTTNLNAQGYRFQRVDIGGRASTPENAKRIRSAVQTVAGEATTIIIIGYSKGANDVLEALRDPATAAAVSAAVVLGGSVFGSELVDQAPDLVIKAVEQTPFPGCATSAREPLQALSTAARAEYMSHWQPPSDVRLYSIAGRPDGSRVSRILVPTYRSLTSLGLANDGQVSVASSYVPGSHWLGHLNADHWAMALPIERSVAQIVSPLVDQNDFPREALLRAIVATAQANL